MMKVFATFDNKAASFGKPMFLPTEGLAKRMFVEACLDPKGDLNKYPEDYSMYEIGAYDPNTGELVGCTPKPLMTAVAAIEIKKAEVAKEVVKKEE